MKVRLLPEADDELTAAGEWYEAKVPGLGSRFLSEASGAFAAIEDHPDRYPRVQFRSSRDLRQRRLPHFPYWIIYEIRQSECLVVAIAHASRRPGYWRKRVERP